MTFYEYEIDHLMKIFPDEKASLKADFADEELEAIDNVGILRNSPHLYLGLNFSKLVKIILFS